MIIELVVMGEEAIDHAEHVLACRDGQCDDIAHLYDNLTARYAGQAEVFTFLAGTARGHQYRLNHARARVQREVLTMRDEVEHAGIPGAAVRPRREGVA